LIEIQAFSDSVLQAIPIVVAIVAVFLGGLIVAFRH